ncbi:unnamed protein product [marine sediment metagenome]|uniref:Uncharacterized protein n=1 Tax=marine sediment metagenome TaxID=412755 RepID=X1N200_9ZZZZ
MMIPEDIQKEWDAHLKEWYTTMGMPKFLDLASNNLLELSSTFSSYALGIASEDDPPGSLVALFSDSIRAYMFAKYVLDDYLWCEERKKVFLIFLKEELDKSKEHLQKIIDIHTKRYRDR